jgi:alpha-L-fucosidase
MVCDVSSEVRRALADPAAAHLAKPTPGQIEWADMELEMFLCLDPCTWQGREYDNGQTPLDQIVLPKLDTDQWCEAALAFGAKQIIHVLKHTGFCWWQTDTTPYSIKNTKVMGGKADLGVMLAASCRKYGLKYGTYMSGADRYWGAAVGSGGRVNDPKRQEEYNHAYRQQMAEVLTRFGNVSEIWFDGGCRIEVGDVIRTHAPDAMVFGGPYETIRWPGTESGKLPYPCWSSIRKEPTSRHQRYVGDPDGDQWCPPECDTVLYGRGGHNWFWSPANEHRRHTVGDLMDIYLKSVGHGGVLLLNATPNTEGLIPEGDMQAYREFGAEIKRRFGCPLARTAGVGNTVELDLGGVKTVNHAWIMEDLRGGHRIRAYILDGRKPDGQWVPLATGISVGHKKIDVFPDAAVDRIRLRVTRNVGTPITRELAVFYTESER